MSAYLVSEYHIHKLLNAWQWHDTQRVNSPKSNDDLTALGKQLLRENARSVAYRYNKPAEDVEDYIFTPLPLSVSDKYPLQLAAWVECLDYQSCETADWDTTAAYRFLNDIRALACRRFPGFDAIRWSA